ncbi:iron-containing redox enzyme family protein [Paraburkholderia caballeronis]|uniref:iron-containing redox enzyme family protein n=1 Tax=Paraburkholderia caballeronis TaxID=416943 RepID=UPI0010EBA6CB|nr:iron-containing redox enzyme family protein [Paraburkholderia caballeronis]TDV01996.1 heme oxygenase-like protein [Paraburkholderia caballeronis]TDV06715.1 heme oxygenase-like protein [Paraburkholderia caballeronis]TDV16138.1 heme oxygenase-like protein [Paraburkholderia caballeronis]
MSQIARIVPSGAAALCHRILNLEQGHASTREASKEFVASLTAEHRAAFQSQLGESQFDVGGVERLISMLTTWAVGCRLRESIACADADCDVVARFVVAQYAPLGLAPGCVLQNFANAANCHEPTAAYAHAAHLWHVADSSLARNHGALYRQLLERTGQYLPKIGSPTFSARAGLLPASWTLAAYRLALSLFPAAFAPEILGSALFELHVPVAPLVDAALGASDELRTHPYMRARHHTSRLDAQRHLELAIERLLADATNDATGIASRVAFGFWVSMRMLDVWQDAVVNHVRDRLLDRTATMVDLIRRKSRFAAGYHGSLKLADRSFDDYVTQDPERFVRDLARSRWIVPGKPSESLLLTRLVAFGGPMFRVFSEQEIGVIRAWVASLDADAARAVAERGSTRTAGAAVGEVDGMPPSFAEPDAFTCDFRRGSTKHVGARELYHRLLNHEDYPGVFDDARVFTETWLARAATLCEREPDAIPFSPYTHEKLRRWFDDRALRQARSYAGQSREIDKSREQVIEEALQLSPMIFVDGGWVQRWTNVGHVDSNVGTLLCKIFSDEIGNGNTLLNHPNIYRELMRQMCIDLPDFRTRAFAESELFSDASFEIPTFWLSISQFPRRFLPETLGLNLAMELSGVGGAYRRARDELRHYQFDTLFVDLHNTIDNVSTGHSAMALEAIELHMDETLSTASYAAVDAQWRRVWTGFCALAIPRRSWKEVFAKPTYAV